MSKVSRVAPDEVKGHVPGFWASGLFVTLQTHSVVKAGVLQCKEARTIVVAFNAS